MNSLSHPHQFGEDWVEQKVGGMPLTSQHSDAAEPMPRVAVVVVATGLLGDYATYLPDYLAES